jgi:hypothetical protein
MVLWLISILTQARQVWDYEILRHFHTGVAGVVLQGSLADIYRFYPHTGAAGLGIQGFLADIYPHTGAAGSGIQGSLADIHPQPDA